MNPDPVINESGAVRQRTRSVTVFMGAVNASPLDHAAGGHRTAEGSPIRRRPLKRDRAVHTGRTPCPATARWARG